MTYQVRLSQFEGPLDLLLHLIRRDKINIYDIPISHITREYLTYIDVMKELQLELAGEFFVMAATLMRIKAQMLLPQRSEDEEEEGDPREELVRNLIEYRMFKEAAQHLAEREDDRRKVFARPGSKPSGDGDERQPMEVSLFDLIGAFRSIMEELKKNVSYQISREQFTVEEKIEFIRSRIGGGSELLFTELFAGQYDRGEVISTFLALLELARLGELVARQMSHGADIWLYSPQHVPDHRREEGMDVTSE